LIESLFFFLIIALFLGLAFVLAKFCFGTKEQKKKALSYKVNGSIFGAYKRKKRLEQRKRKKRRA